MVWYSKDNFNFIGRVSGLPNTVHPYTWIFFSKYIYCFWSTVGSLQMQRTGCMHWCMRFYIGDLSIYRFWYLRGVLDTIPRRYKWTTYVLGESNVVHDFWLYGDQYSNPCVVQVSTVLFLLMMIISMEFYDTMLYSFSVYIINKKKVWERF